MATYPIIKLTFPEFQKIDVAASVERPTCKNSLIKAKWRGSDGKWMFLEETWHSSGNDRNFFEIKFIWSDDPTPEEVDFYLEYRGWHCVATDYPHIGRIYIWRDRPDSDFGMSTRTAYLCQKKRDREREREQGVKEGIAKVCCNNCGQSLRIEEQGRDGPFFCGYYGLVHASVTGGFNSPAFDDCTNYTFSLCEHCLKALFQNFTIPVEKQNMLV